MGGGCRTDIGFETISGRGQIVRINDVFIWRESFSIHVRPAPPVSIFPPGIPEAEFHYMYVCLCGFLRAHARMRERASQQGANMVRV